ncbi:hypothetical protein SAMN06295960_3427 [Paenibacillus aquistagni]|uniref:Uncharacterized protein n=1 Tax=Paenibacillus aquistagni TaxID=1852522 RepID=A0A1X7LI53_9BACL|nr:hypothetical protein SAMN06295960_3427 [Paenibacillus aquistagni]
MKCDVTIEKNWFYEENEPIKISHILLGNNP